MERFGKLVLLLFAAAALGIAAWLISSAGGGGSSGGETAPEAPAASATLTTTPRLASSAAADERQESTRTAVAEAGARPEDDPDIRAALAKFVGRVVAHDGKPVPDRVVRFYRLDLQIVLQPEQTLLSDPIQDFPDLIAGEATTAADGRFEVAGVWPRAIYLLKADAEGPNPTMKIADRTPAPAETVDLGDIVLKDAGVLTGQVVDDSGDPVAGAMVRAADVPPIVTQVAPIEQFDPEGWLIGGNGDERMVVEMPGWVKKYWRELPVPTTVTGADGAFRLEGVEPGVNLVAATKSGYVGATQKNVKVEPGQERALGKLVLREGEVAAGKVVDTAGKPIAGVQVIVGSRLTMAPIAFGRDAGETDARGAFECSGMKAGDVVAAARRSRGDPWTITAPQSIQKSLLITLPARHTLTVRLLSQAERPIASPRLSLLNLGSTKDGGMVTPFAMLGFAPRVSLAARQRTLEDGRIQITDLDAARYVVLGSAAGHGAAVENVDLTADREVDVRLPAAHVVEVQVLDGSDAPVRNAAVYVELRGKGVELFPMHAGHTDAAGRVTIRDAARESAIIEATHPRYGVAMQQTPLPPTGPVVIHFAEPGAIEGEVTEDGKPPELGKYMVVANRQWNERHGPMSGMPAMTVLSPDGTFALRGLQPGGWRVEVVNSVQAMNSFGSMAETMLAMRVSGELPEEEVELAAGKTMHVRLETNQPRVVDGPSANVSGTVIIDGRPGVGMVVQGWSERRLLATVEPSGRFDLGPVKAGQIHLTLVDGSAEGMGFNRNLWSKSVEVKAGNDVHLPIEITTGSVGGEVYDQQGRPAAGVRVNLSRRSDGGADDTGRGSSSGLTDSEGRFTIERLPMGRYGVVADAGDAGRGTAWVEVAAGGRASARLVLAPVYAVAGKIDLARLDLKPSEGEQRWVWLQFEGARGSNGEPASPDSGRGWAQADAETGTFKSNRMSPGRYRVQIHCNAPGQWEHDGVVEVVDRDLENLTITPVRKEPPKPQRSGG